MFKMHTFGCESHQGRGEIQLWEDQLLAQEGNAKEKLSSESSLNLFSALLSEFFFSKLILAKYRYLHGSHFSAW